MADSADSTGASADQDAATALRSLRSFVVCDHVPLLSLGEGEDCDLGRRAGAILLTLATAVRTAGPDSPNQDILADAIEGAASLIWLAEFGRRAADRQRPLQARGQ